MQPFQEVERQRVHYAFGKAAGAEPVEPPFTPMLDQGFGQDASGRVAGAKEQDVVGLLDHQAGLRASMVADTT